VGLQARAHLLSMNGAVLESIGPIIGGQVNVDTTQAGQSTRTATVILSDPGHTMGFDSNSPAGSATSIDRMLRLEHTTYVPALRRRVTCPLITGPIRGFSRNGTEVTLTVVGREDLMLGNAWRTRTYRKGQYKTDVLEDLLEFYGGVASPGIPSLGARLSTHLSLARISVPWTVAESLAESMNRQLFYNGEGLPILRPHPAKPVITLYEGDQGLHASDLLGETQISYALGTGWFNAVQVVGATPAIQAFSLPSPNSPLHPARLNGNGAWAVRMTEEQNPHFRSKAEAQARADTLMDQQEAQQVQVTAVAKCFPCLEENDFIRIATKSGTVTFRLTTFSIDLAGAGMSLGYKVLFAHRRAPRPLPKPKPKHHPKHHRRRHK
jgi:hypothetical protein